MFIQTEATPNPGTLKFIPGRPVSPHHPMEFSSVESAQDSPLARSLFQIEGVCRVFFGADFVAVSKEHGEWSFLKPLVLSALMDHYLSDRPVFEARAPQESPSEDLLLKDEDREIIRTIKELLEARVRPAVAQDGGDITFHHYKDGVVYLKMRGACSGCPSSTATLKHGIENLLKHFIPEVQDVCAV